MLQNKINGKLSEIYAQHDLIDNGFSIFYVGRYGIDLFAAKSLSDDILQLWIEIKYNKSRLSKRQKQFKNFCRKMKLNHFTYRVTPNQLQHWLSQRSEI